MMKSNKIFVFLLTALAIALLSVSVHSQGSTSTSTPCGLLPSSIQQQVQSGEPWYCPINDQIYSEWSGEIPLAFLAVLVAFMIAAIIFMAGTAFGNDRIRNFGIGELYEATATAIIVGAFMYLCAVIFGILPAIVAGPINPYATAFNLITSTIASAQNMFASLFNVYMTLSYTVSPTILPSVGGGVGALARTLISTLPQIIVNVLSIPITIFFLDPALAISTFLAEGISVLYAEYYLMVFFATAAIPAFLIPGVILRAIFPTRAVGGVLIAFAIGFYLIMPTLFAVAFYFTAPSVMLSMQVAATQITRFGTGPITQAISPSSPLVLQLNAVQSSLNGFWLLILFYPSLIIAMTYTAIQEISRFIGGATAVSARAGSIRRFI
ncbi:MAG: hypothetical protein ABSE71_05410 [Candidatus Micrarchaeaceae archaeon]|jgi:ABC-type cobalt transport system substrate-binding protein